MPYMRDYQRLKNSLISCSTSTYVFYYLYYVEQPYPSLPLISLMVRRHYVHPASLQKAFKTTIEKAGITKKASVHTIIHSFAIHLLENGHAIKTIQELMGHQNMRTTMIYLNPCGYEECPRCSQPAGQINESNGGPVPFLS